MLRKDVITVKTVALTGKSGTGKSYRSIWLAAEKNLEYIIDDGILIIIKLSKAFPPKEQKPKSEQSSVPFLMTKSSAEKWRPQ